MNKILTICITCHGEPKHKIIPLLRMLDSQMGNVFDKVKFILSNNSDIPTDYQLFSEYKNILPHCILKSNKKIIGNTEEICKTQS